ncbi:hypothetical protein ACTXT7_010488 [Hymenolepis weldensis]
MYISDEESVRLVAARITLTIVTSRDPKEFGKLLLGLRVLSHQVCVFTFVVLYYYVASSCNEGYFKSSIIDNNPTYSVVYDASSTKDKAYLFLLKIADYVRDWKAEEIAFQCSQVHQIVEEFLKTINLTLLKLVIPMDMD